MKTTTDIAAFLKRTGVTLSLSYDAPTGKFLAHTKGDEATSQHLDDALENVAEELRRRANKMDSVREKKTADSTLPAPFSHSASYAAMLAAAYGVPVYAPPPLKQYPTCHGCGSYPAYGIPAGMLYCPCGTSWAASAGTSYKFTAHTNPWSWDGSAWNQVTP